MVARAPKKPTCTAPAGTKSHKNMTKSDFEKPMKGAHHGKMDAKIAKKSK